MGFLYGLIGILVLMGLCAITEDIVDSWKGRDK